MNFAQLSLVELENLHPDDTVDCWNGEAGFNRRFT